MGKKFISLTTNGTRYRLYSDDIRVVFQKPVRKLPLPPRFPPSAHPLTEEHAHSQPPRSFTAASNAS